MNKKNKKIVFLIDSYFCLYKIYFAYPELKNRNGKTTTIIYGIIKIINDILKKFQPKNIIFIFDTPKKTLRHKLYKKYKKNRTPMPKNLYNQISSLKKIINFMGIPIICINHIEADDIIGTLSVIFKKKKFHTIIYSADKDMIQLINDKVYIIQGDTKKNILKKKDIYKQYGIFPKSMADFLGLVGDPSDNIPGVYGIGKKTAITLLKHFNSIKKIYKNIKKIKELPIYKVNNIIKKLQKGKKSAFLAYQLTKINTNINLKINISHLIIKKPNIEKLINKFKDYQFNQYLQDIYQDKFPILKYYKNNYSFKK